MNDNDPMHPTLRAAAASTRRLRVGTRRGTARLPCGQPKRQARGWRLSFDPMMVIPLCCTIALAVNAMLA